MREEKENGDRNEICTKDAKWIQTMMYSSGNGSDMVEDKITYTSALDGVVYEFTMSMTWCGRKNAGVTVVTGEKCVQKKESSIDVDATMRHSILFVV